MNQKRCSLIILEIKMTKKNKIIFLKNVTFLFVLNKNVLILSV